MYRPSSFLGLVQDVVELLDQFTTAADPRLMPAWWHGLEALRRDPEKS